MIIFENNDKYYVYIHIPKNSGKYIRKQITDDKNNKIIKKCWGIQQNKKLDLAHIPYMKRNELINNNIDYQYFSYSRNPYDRIISAYFYVHRKVKKTINDFVYFCKNILTKLDFNSNFNSDIIHYYPQYLFLCDDNFNVADNHMNHVTVEKIEDYPNSSPTKYDLKKYFDKESIQIINKIYEKDFLLFNYEMLHDIYL
jgi:hypothetical protein